MRRGSGLGVLVAVVSVLALASALTACSGDATTESTTTTVEAPVESTTTTEVPLEAGRQLSFYVPAVGDCFDLRPIDQAPPVHLVLDCALPHQREVFATTEWTATKEYPGPDPLEAQAKLECPRAWDAYVGAPYETSRFELAYDLPDQAGWGNGVRHVIGCLIVDPHDAPITGSARGVAQ